MAHNRQFRPMTKWLAIAMLFWSLTIFFSLLVLRGETVATTVSVFLAIIGTLPAFLQLLANHQDFLPALEELPAFLLAIVGLFFKWLLRKFWPILAVALSFTLLFTLWSNGLIPWFHPSPRTQASSCPLPANASPSDHYIDITPINGAYVGLSEGKFIFDKSAADRSEKEKAASLFRQNTFNNSELINDWQAAHQKASNDAEALIYLENLRVANQNTQNYIDIVVGVNFERNNLGGTRDVLQGAYVAQVEFNRTHAMQIRLLIANSGSTPDRHIQDVMCQILKAAGYDKHLVGMMGWFLSRDVVDSIPLINDNHFLVVSATASSNDLAGNPYFLRINPSDQLQGQAGAKFARETLKATKVAVFEDTNDSYSRSLADSFCQQYIGGACKETKTSQGALVAVELYTTGSHDTAFLQYALKKKPDLLYFAGYASDAGILFQKLSPCQISSRVDPSCPAILGGDSLYNYGDYSSAGLPTGRTFFTAFAEHDEWLFHSQKEPPFVSQFFSDFSNTFVGDQSKIDSYGFGIPGGNAMLVFDGISVMATAANNFFGTTQNIPTSEQLQQEVRKFTGSNTFPGVTGPISFDRLGNAANKVVLVLYFDKQGLTQIQDIQGCIQDCPEP